MWIANSIFAYQVEFIAYDANGKSITTVFEDSGQRTVTRNEVYMYRKAVESKANLGKQVMVSYLKANASTYGLESSSDCDPITGSCSTSGDDTGIAFLN